MREFFFALIFTFCFYCPLQAGEIVEVPQDIVLHDPLTHHVELQKITFYYSATNPYAKLEFDIISDTGDFITHHSVTVEDVAPDTDFTDFISGYGGTMKSRANVINWSFIQDNYTTQAIP